MLTLKNRLGLALVAFFLLLGTTTPEIHAADKSVLKEIDNSTCSFDPPWLDCLQVGGITAGAICGCSLACGSSPTNPFSAVACYGCLFGAGAWETTLGPDVRNCVCWAAGQGHATASGECSGTGTEPPTVSFCPYNPGVAWCKNGARISDSKIYLACINTVESMKKHGDFNATPYGTFGACIAKCYNNTTYYAGERGCSGQPPTNTPTDTPTNTPTNTPTKTPIATETPTAPPTNTPKNTATYTPEPTLTPKNTATYTPEPTLIPEDTETYTPEPI